MRIFISGVVQASNHGTNLTDQGYRGLLARALTARWPDTTIVDPLQLHPNSVNYDDAQATETLLALADLAGDCDLVVAYLPTASMGTALEMHSAYRRGVPVLTISPMSHNWVVRAFSRRIFADIPGFLDALQTAASPADLS